MPPEQFAQFAEGEGLPPGATTDQYCMESCAELMWNHVEWQVVTSSF